MKINLKEELEAGASAYDELLKKDWRLRLEEEALQRRLEEKENTKKVKNAKEEAEKKKSHKNTLRRRRPWF